MIVTVKRSAGKFAFFRGQRFYNGDVITDVTPEEFSKVWMVKGKKSGKALEKAKTEKSQAVTIQPLKATDDEAQQKLV